MLEEVRVPDGHFTEGELSISEVRATVGEFVVERLDVVVAIHTPICIFLISATAHGLITQMNVAVGDSVHQGDVLFVIDTSVPLPDAVRLRWIDEFDCPFCGSRLINRQIDSNPNETDVPRRDDFETGDCEHCRVKITRDRLHGIWGRWSGWERLR